MLHKIAFAFLWLLIFLIPVEEIYTIPGFGTVTRLAGLLAAGVWLIIAIFTDRIRKPHLYHWLFILFILWNLTSIFWTIGLERTTDRLVTYVQLIGLAWIMWDLTLEVAQLRAIIQAFILGAYLAIGDAVNNYLNATVFVSTSGGVATGRYSATGFNPNDLSLMLVLAMPLAWYLVLESEKPGFIPATMRLLNLLFIPAAIFTVLLTASRGSFLIMLPVLALMGIQIFRLPGQRRVGIALVVVVCLAIMIPLAPQTLFDRLIRTSASAQQGEVDGRINIWAQGVDVFVERPLLGVGSNAFRLAIELGAAPHNSYLSVLVDLGIIGLILFAVLIGVVIRQVFYHPPWQRLLWLTIIVAWLMGNMVHNWENRKPTWFFLSLIVVSANLLVVSDNRKTTRQPTIFRNDISAKRQPNSYKA